jgi:hypothetical protein
MRAPMPPGIHSNHKFKASSVLTRRNSLHSKYTAIQNLLDRGCSDIYLITCPGPAIRRERSEHLLIKGTLTSYRFDLTVINREINPEVAKKHRIPYGCVIETANNLVECLPDSEDTGIFFEFDQTSTHKRIENEGYWDEAMAMLQFSARRFPTVFSYTHCVRKDWRRTAEITCTEDLFFNAPWQSILSQQVKGKLLWSSRNYWRSQPRTPHGMHCYRWVWSIGDSNGCNDPRRGIP